MLDSRRRPGPGPTPEPRLAARAAASREGLPELLVDERGAVDPAEVFALTGSTMDGGVAVAEWRVAERSAPRCRRPSIVAAYHAEHPLEEGAGLTPARSTVGDALRSRRATDAAPSRPCCPDPSRAAWSPATRRPSG